MAFHISLSSDTSTTLPIDDLIFTPDHSLTEITTQPTITTSKSHVNVVSSQLTEKSTPPNGYKTSDLWLQDLLSPETPQLGLLNQVQHPKELEPVDRMKTPVSDVSNSATEPAFPGCSKIRATEDKLNYAVMDLWKETSFHRPAAKTCLRKLKDAQIPLTSQTLTWQWIDTAWVPLTPAVTAWTVARQDLQPWLNWMLQRRRVSQMFKQQLANKFQLNVGLPCGPIEAELLEMIQMAYPCEMHRQYRIGPYKLDAYLPEHHLALEIDEKGHTHYPPEEEAARQAILEKHQLHVLRHNPDTEDIWSFIRRIWAHTLTKTGQPTDHGKI